MTDKPHYWRSRIQLFKIIMWDKSFMIYSHPTEQLKIDDTHMEGAKALSKRGVRSYFMNCHYDPFKPTVH